MSESICSDVYDAGCNCNGRCCLPRKAEPWCSLDCFLAVGSELPAKFFKIVVLLGHKCKSLLRPVAEAWQIFVDLRI